MYATAVSLPRAARFGCLLTLGSESVARVRIPCGYGRWFLPEFDLPVDGEGDDHFTVVQGQIRYIADLDPGYLHVVASL